MSGHRSVWALGHSALLKLVPEGDGRCAGQKIGGREEPTRGGSGWGFSPTRISGLDTDEPDEMPGDTGFTGLKGLYGAAAAFPAAPRLTIAAAAPAKARTPILRTAALVWLAVVIVVSRQIVATPVEWP